jgi:copper(I)-binding protein
VRAVASTLALLLLAACAGPGPALRVDGAWSRPTAGAGPGVAYFAIANEGTAADRLVGARSPCCGVVEIHRTSVENGRASMAPVAGGVVVPADSTVAFEPGGYHLMLLEPREPLRAGARFLVLLEFERSGEVEVEVAVR